MPRWWCVTIAIAGAWLVTLGAGEFGLLTKLSVGAVETYARYVVFGICVIASIQCARQGSAAWCGILAFLAALLNPLAPVQWPAGWEKTFELAGGCVMLTFGIRQWK